MNTPLPLLFLAALLLLLKMRYAPPHPHPPPPPSTSSNLQASPLPLPPPPPPPRTWGSFYLSLFWPPGYCIANPAGCLPNKMKEDFTIHGLWPQTTQQSSGPAYVDGLINQDLRDRLDIYWSNLERDPNRAFWEHEWNKHGKISNSLLGEVDYFERAIQLYLATNVTTILANYGILPSDNSPTTLASVSQAFGSTPIVVCRKGRNSNTMYITEIRLCYDASAINLISCTQAQLSCGTQPIYLKTI
ncbi:PREDICTED: ribonuclease DdI-like [Ipomoea nil]|uniref:ribonuclease DdI-like n=1 Tax=Ipomoea nil TaxID=35883 RepID=UPI0009012943|nr:PREDICTED: ribonuclease DdI-like [Ipomoea nil]